MVTPPRSYNIYRIINSKWTFWMTARGYSEAQIINAVQYHSKLRQPLKAVRCYMPHDKDKPQS